MSAITPSDGRTAVVNGSTKHRGAATELFDWRQEAVGALG